jgi:hypothetical protein
MLAQGLLKLAQACPVRRVKSSTEQGVLNWYLASRTLRVLCPVAGTSRREGSLGLGLSIRSYLLGLLASGGLVTVKGNTS